MGRRSNNGKEIDQKHLSRGQKISERMGIQKIRKQFFKHKKQKRGHETSREEHHGKDADQNAISCSTM